MTHRRAEPAHRFTSRVALPLLFLDELARLRTAHPLVDLDPSAHRRRWPAAIRFRRGDYLPSGSPTVQGAVAEAVAGRRGLRAGSGGDARPRPHLGMALQPAHPVLLLRPVGAGGRVDGPRGVQHPVARAPRLRRRTAGSAHASRRRMHVSPFLPAQGHLHPALLRTRGRHQGQPRRRCADPALAVWSGGRTGPRHTGAPAVRLHGLAAEPARSGRVGPAAVGVSADDDTGVERHLRAGGATRRTGRTVPPAPRSGGRRDRSLSATSWCAAGAGTGDEPDERISAPASWPGAAAGSDPAPCASRAAGYPGRDLS